MMGFPEFLAIGHITKDRYGDTFRAGGAVYYGSVTAKKLGKTVSLVTSHSGDFEVPKEMSGIDWVSIPSSATTVFQNVYDEQESDGYRTQFLSSCAERISIVNIPPKWRNPDIVYLAPMVDEIGLDVASAFPNAKIVASIQGWTRHWGSNGKITSRDWDGKDILPYVDVAVCSHEDIYSNDNLKTWIDCVPILIVTCGSVGSRIYESGSCVYVESVPNTEVDPTGAGDVYASSFMVRYMETNDSLRAARFASLVAGLSIQSHGTDSLPDRSMLLEQYQNI